MKLHNFLGAFVLVLSFAVGASAQEGSEVSGGGGGGITTAGGSGTAGRVPQFASTTSLEDSKMLTSGTNKGTWTLYDNTAVTGNTSLVVKGGAGQALDLFSGLDNAGTSRFGFNLGNYTLYVGGTSSVRIIGDGARALVFPGMGSPANIYGDGYAEIAATNLKLQYPDGTPNVGLAYSAPGILKITDGSSGQGGIGLSDAATATVSDALILRHATTDAGFGQDGFGTGLLFQAENSVGTMHDAASIDAVFVDSADGSEDAEIWFNTFASGADGAALVISRDAIRGNNLHLNAADGSGHIFFDTANTTRWLIIGGGAGRFIPNADNTYDIGASTNRVANIYASGLQVSDDANTAVSDAITLRHNLASTTAGVGMGTGLLFQGEDDAGNMQDMASIDAVYANAADTTEEARLVFKNYHLGTEATFLTMWQQFGETYLASPGHLGLNGSAVRITTTGVSPIYFSTSYSDRWLIESSGPLRPNTTNTYDIGTSSAFVRNNYVSTSIQGTRTQAISDNAAAATFVTIAVPTSDTTVGGRIFYTITAIDAGTAIQTKTGTYSFGLNNIGGTVTGNGTDVLEHSQLSTGTLAPTFSVNISGTNAQFQLVLDTSLDAGAETLKIEYRVQIDSGTATVTPAT